MSRVSVKTKALQWFSEIEVIVCPVVVFCIGYLHHLYFAYDTISPLFVACSLVSVALVLGYNKNGLILSAVLQACIVGYVIVDAPDLFLEQAAFSMSVLTALAATYYSRDEQVTTRSKNSMTLAEQKEKLWQELFDARKEITALYAQKEELIARIATLDRDRADAQLLVEERIEVLQNEKKYLKEDIEEAEVNIAKLLQDMREMAERQVSKKRELQPFEAMYNQLKMQFEEKQNVLDASRKELFHAQEEIEVLKKTLSYEVQVPSQVEKALTEQLAKTQNEIDELQKKHSDELMGYEEIIQRLLQQVNDAKASGSHDHHR